jgi:hypothetical protein
MKKFAQFFAIILVLICVTATESFPFTAHEAAATERCDDFRETEEFRVSAASIKVSRVVPASDPAISYPPIAKNDLGIFHPVHILSESLYLRLRVLRN